jgi:multisubunit Na+/H+ antiporter MnhB subunit
MVRRRAAGGRPTRGIVARVGEASGNSRRDRLRGALAALAALHSVGIGLGLAFLPGWASGLAGFPPVTPVFFARQGGAFHLVLGVAYWLEHRRAGTTWLLLLAKGTATLFLGAATLGGGVPWSVPASLLADAGMGLAAWLLRPRAA